MTRHFGTCMLCEAACGITVETQDDKVTSIRGDVEDAMSAGYVCPKVVGMQDLYEDPDRLTKPLVKKGTDFVETDWEDALDRAANGIRRVRAKHGPHSLAVYQGNPAAHNLGLLSVGQAVLRTMGTKNLYSASTTDQIPHMMAAHEMFGAMFLVPIPDIDRTKHWLILGANPVVSNGSLMTAPDVKRRIDAIQARGGKVVVVDPRKTETAKIADEHVFLKPGTDTVFLLSMIHVLFEEQLDSPGRLVAYMAGYDQLRQIAKEFSPESMAHVTGVDAQVVRRLAREFSDAESAVAYGRLGTCHQEFGTLASWAFFAINAITGNLDRPGGSMWANPAVDVSKIAEMLGMAGHGRFQSRVRNFPETAGELPIAVLAEEIETPGAGQVRALLTCAGNPVLSAPNGKRLEKAFASLEHMVSIDWYLNETTKHAHVILPPVSPLQRSHFDLALSAFSVRNHAKYVPAVFPKKPGERDDAQIVAELGVRIRLGTSLVAKGISKAAAKLATPERALDGLLRMGPHPLTLNKLRAHPHGLDMGPLVPRIPEILPKKNPVIILVPQLFADEIPALQKWIITQSTPRPDKFSLIGRRHLRSNNSWLHNSARLTKGPARCTLLMHPQDAEKIGLTEGAQAEIESTQGCARFAVELTEDISPGVISVPHGWGHHRAGTQMRVASQIAGTSINDVTEDSKLDRLTGNAAFSSMVVTVRPVSSV